ncbi:ABC-2 type transport system permease protein [Sinobaca qinghaiensis]|uniref:ABC-2 type transport system permease protein n=1 Tax=Sinobaca qinghaiensis TaxID=342944 RepID=A0A419V4E2_9BACL|nr:ABC transporter permease [Sinobaca qinghaiensis]RKD73377.1 ABC-2 type transport system permease protein [Sinobaca qinghaiensis]
MSKFTALVKNEFMKLFSRTGTWVMAGILAVVIIGGALITLLNTEPPADNWRAEVQQQVEGDREALAEDPEAVFLQERLTLNNYRLDNDIAPINDATQWGFVDFVSILTMFVTLFTVIAATSSVAGEFTNGTIKLLLIRPVKRWMILLSKLIVSLFYAAGLLLLLFVTAYLAGGLFFGFQSPQLTTLYIDNGQVVEQSMAASIWAGYGLAMVNLVMMTIFAFMIAAIFRNSSIAIGLTIFLMFAGTNVVVFLSQYDWAKYILFANTDLRMYFGTGEPLIDGMTLGFSIVILAIYFAVFAFLTFFVFSKRDVAA